MAKEETLVTILEETSKLMKIAKKGKQSIKNATNSYGRKFISLKSKSSKILKELERKTSGLGDETKSSLINIKNNVDVFFDPNTITKTRNSLFTRILDEYLSNVEPHLNKNKNHNPSNNLFPLELVDDTKSYIKKTANQACGCYDLDYFDASAVMTRKLLETLIIECFEFHEISSKIKNGNGDFFYLSDLITKFLNEHQKSWNVGRNVRKGLPKLKSVGDRSAHSRRFNAIKPDLEDLREDLRNTIEELVIISKNK
ncbi:MAG: hypothetical protein OER82_02050 [Nitrosopumilus sp.]|nr:hypothetical protein [Nitrosopumilus sp.]